MCEPETLCVSEAGSSSTPSARSEVRLMSDLWGQHGLRRRRCCKMASRRWLCNGCVLVGPNECVLSFEIPQGRIPVGWLVYHFAE